ncbi:MAG: Trk system potassium transporter TrkA [Phycisphaeraceae bacterium]|jgi:trk system potassium uptake protein TrkA
MNILICGAGEVGRHSAEVLADSGHSITILDQSPTRLAEIDEVMDVRSMLGDCAQAEVLIKAGVERADLIIAATNNDEVNLLSASVAKGVGCKTAIARVHRSGFYEDRGLSYAKHLGIDHLVCPEFATARAIAAALRSPGALAVENFAQGLIEMQRIVVSESSKAVGVPLRDLKCPGTSLIACIERPDRSFVPKADTQIKAGDVVTVIGEAKGISLTTKFYNPEHGGRRRIMVMGGSTQSVWLSRELRRVGASVRQFIADEDRAIELAEKLDGVTVINADVINSEILQEERVDQTDAFVAATDDEETNILGAALAKTRGAKTAVAVMQRPTYLHLLEHIGIDRAFSPRGTAVNEIMRLLDTRPLRHLATLSREVAELYEVHLGDELSKAVADKPLMEIEFPPRCLVAAISRGDQVYVPGAQDKFEPGDVAIILGPNEVLKPLNKLFGFKHDKKSPVAADV